VNQFQMKSTATKGSARALICLGVCGEFERERLWVEEWVQGREFEVETEIDEDEAAAAANGISTDPAEGVDAKGKGKSKEVIPESTECEEGEGIECGCCFSTFVIVSQSAQRNRFVYTVLTAYARIRWYNAMTVTCSVDRARAATLRSVWACASRRSSVWIKKGAPLYSHSPHSRLACPKCS
jgi:hypothetical protein